MTKTDTLIKALEKIGKLKGNAASLANAALYQYYQIKWEYCECGCHGFVCEEDYWDLFDTNLNIHHLYKGHGPYGPKLGTYTSLPECSKVIVEKLKGTTHA